MANNDLARPPQMQQGSVPVPDPTVRAVEALEKAIANLKELMAEQITSTRNIIEARLNGNDKAIELLQVSSNKISPMINAEVSRLQELHEEKFGSIATQFRERDTRTEQAAKDSKVAIDAALQAQKEAVSEQNKSNAQAITKSEAFVTKQIDQITALISATAKATDDKIDDLKTRTQAIESHGKGLSDGYGWIVAFIGMMVGGGGLIAYFAK